MFLRGRTARAIAVASMAAALSGAGMTAAWADSAAPPSCSGTTVQISNVDFKVVGGDVVVTFSHTHTGCAATLHVHENLVASPKAGSDPNHQLNQDFSIGPDGPTSVSVPLLASADNKCFVQVDVHFNVDQSTGGFVPTATCTTPSSSPPSTSPTATPSTSRDAEYLTDGDAEYDADADADADAEHLSSASGRSDAEPVTECASAGHDRNGSAASR